LLGCCFMAASLAVVSRTHNPLYTSENTPGTYRTIYLKEREKPLKTISYCNSYVRIVVILRLTKAIFTKAHMQLSSYFLCRRCCRKQKNGVKPYTIFLSKIIFFFTTKTARLHRASSILTSLSSSFVDLYEY
jgi:hypothetical protein